MYDNGTAQTTIDYVNGYQYKNGSLDFFAMEAGRVKKTVSGTLRYEYNLTDHLGNTRVSFADTLGNGTAVILQEDHYYAFGLRIEGLSSTTKDNKFTYNGKELEDEHGLNWYHYGARYYDPQVGRWWTVDPRDELMAAYGFVANNPLRYVDPEGKDIDDADIYANGSPEMIASAEAYAQTDEGYSQLALFARAGQTAFTREFAQSGKHVDQTVEFLVGAKGAKDFTTPIVTDIGGGQHEFALASGPGYVQKFQISMSPAGGTMGFYNMAESFHHEMRHVILFQGMIPMNGLVHFDPAQVSARHHSLMFEDFPQLTERFIDQVLSLRGENKNLWLRNDYMTEALSGMNATRKQYEEWHGGKK